MAVEVKQTLERDFDVSLSMKEIRALTVDSLKSLESKRGGDNSPSIGSQKSE